MDEMAFILERVAYIKQNRTLNEIFQYRSLLPLGDDGITLRFYYTPPVSLFFMDILLGKFKPYVNQSLTYFNEECISINLQFKNNYRFIEPSLILRQEPVEENKLLIASKIM